MTGTEYKELRESIGNQEAVAKLLGIRRETISRREAAASNPITIEAGLALKWLAANRETDPAPPDGLG